MGWRSRSRSGLLLALGLVVGAACNGSSDDTSHHPDGGMGTPDGGGAGAAPVDCDVVAPRSCPTPVPTYADVEPIFQARCVGCHAGIPDGPWALTSYEHVASWAGEIRGAMLSCAMPPADSGIEMPTEEREEILLWIRCGFEP